MTKFIAEVAKNDDPEKQGRLKVKCIGITGDAEAETGWITSNYASSSFYIPKIGELIEVNIDETSNDFYGVNRINGMNIKYSGISYYTENRPIPDILKKNYPDRFGMLTQEEDGLLIDRKEKQVSVVLTEEGKKSQVTLTPDNLIVSSHVGTTLIFNNKDGTWLLVDKNGNRINSSETGIQFGDSAGNTVSLEDGTFQVLANDVVIKGSVNLGEGLFKTLLAETFLPMFDSHIHAGLGTPPAIPLSTMEPLLTTKHVKMS